MKKLTVVGMIILLIGMCIPSSGINVEKSTAVHVGGNIAFAWRESPRGPCYFNLNDPGNITQLATYGGTIYLSGGTWTNDGRYLGCDLYNGDLYEVETDTGHIIGIGSGGNDLNGLAYNPINNKLYGAGSFSLYEVDIYQHVLIPVF